MTVVPYKNAQTGKKVQVEQMFDQISNRYDFLNHFLSLNIDKVWRRNAVRLLEDFQPDSILDIATGTADFALSATRLKPSRITGIDLSEGMLAIGRQKVKRRGLEQTIELIKGDSEALPFEENSFDAAIVAFGVRNFENLEKGLSEIYRVIKPGGGFIVLEFSQPRVALLKKLYFLYFTKLLPLLGQLVSKDKNAYHYLPESVKEFPDGEQFISILKQGGFQNVHSFPQTFGISSVYTAQKPKNSDEKQ